jgi:hypothetical protein
MSWYGGAESVSEESTAWKSFLSARCACACIHRLADCGEVVRPSTLHTQSVRIPRCRKPSPRRGISWISTRLSARRKLTRCRVLEFPKQNKSTLLESRRRSVRTLYTSIRFSRRAKYTATVANVRNANTSSHHTSQVPYLLHTNECIAFICWSV